MLFQLHLQLCFMSIAICLIIQYLSVVLEVETCMEMEHWRIAALLETNSNQCNKTIIPSQTPTTKDRETTQTSHRATIKILKTSLINSLNQHHYLIFKLILYMRDLLL